MSERKFEENAVLANELEDIKIRLVELEQKILIMEEQLEQLIGDGK